MRRRARHTPRLQTIGVALILVFVGVIGTFGRLIPTLLDVPGATIGVAAFVAATLILLLGIFFERV